MKYLALLVLFLCESVFGCIIGPERIEVTNEMGFSFETTESSFCKSCSKIHIVAPSEFRSEEYSHSLFTFYVDGELVTRTISMQSSKFNKAEFIAVIALENNWSYEVSFLYGEHSCMSYELLYSEKK